MIICILDSKDAEETLRIVEGKNPEDRIKGSLSTDVKSGSMGIPRGTWAILPRDPDTASRGRA
jgi:hypothetical protein